MLLQEKIDVIFVMNLRPKYKYYHYKYLASNFFSLFKTKYIFVRHFRLISQYKSMLKMNFNNVNQSQKFRNNLNTFYRSDLKPALRIDNLKFKKLKQPHLVINSIENNFARNLTFKSKLKFLRKRKSIAYQKFLKQLT
jgi:hypothetical protein